MNTSPKETPKEQKPQSNTDDKLCPKCERPLAKVPRRQKTWHCVEHGYWKAKVKRRRSSFKANDSSTWRARCDDCGGSMSYYNLKYGCDSCGNVMYV